MDISPACSAPIQPAISESERVHPRFAEYSRYRAAMNRQLVTGLSFARWLESKEEFENGREVVFHTLPGAQLAQGWYKHKFLPNKRMPLRFGPFASETEAGAA
jgi:hypothetical protein